MDLSLHSLMHQNVPSVELNRRIVQNRINTGRFAEILAQASATDAAKGQTNKSKISYSRSASRRQNRAKALSAARRTAELPSGDTRNAVQANVSGDPEVSRMSRPEHANTTSQPPTLGRELPSRNIIDYCPSVPPSLSKCNPIIDTGARTPYT